MHVVYMNQVLFCSCDDTSVKVYEWMHTRGCRRDRRFGGASSKPFKGSPVNAFNLVSVVLCQLHFSRKYKKSLLFLLIFWPTITVNTEKCWMIIQVKLWIRKCYINKTKLFFSFTQRMQKKQSSSELRYGAQN